MIYVLYSNQAVSEIKLLCCALTGCTSLKTVHPEIAPCTLPIHRNDKLLKKRAHTGCTPPKIMHPAVKMCTPGAGCPLNFGHCQGTPCFCNTTQTITFSRLLLEKTLPKVLEISAMEGGGEEPGSSGWAPPGDGQFQAHSTTDVYTSQPQQQVFPSTSQVI